MSWRTRTVDALENRPTLWAGLKIAYPWYRRARTTLSRNPRLRWVKVEVTNRCNLRCSMCATHLSSRHRGTMATAVAEDALRQLPQARIDTIMLVSMGEPMLHPDLATIARAAGARRAADTFLATNGTVLGDDESVATLLRSGLNHVHFSAEGYDAATYESIRIGGRFETFLANLARFRRIRDEVSPSTRIDLAYTLVRPHRPDELHEVQRVFGDLADSVEFRVLHNSSHPEVAWRPEERIHGIACYARRPLPCIALWCGLTVNWDGTVSLCPRDHDLDFVVGSVESSLHAAWTSPDARRLRSDHVHGRFPATCRGCSDLYALPLGHLEVERTLARLVGSPPCSHRSDHAATREKEPPHGR